MSGRNNKHYDQNGQDPKVVRQAQKPIKRNHAMGQKDHLECKQPAKKTTKSGVLKLFEVAPFLT